MDPTIYSSVNYNESANVLAEWQALVAAAQGVYDQLDLATQAAFFELVLHPCMAGEIVHRIHLTAGMQNSYAYEWRQSANKLAQDVLDFFGDDAALTKRYHSLLGGKWNHILVSLNALAVSIAPPAERQLTQHAGPNAYWIQLVAAADEKRSATYVVRARF